MPSPGVYLWQAATETIPLAEVSVMAGHTQVHILFRAEDVRALLEGLDVEHDDIERVLAQELTSPAEPRARG